MKKGTATGCIITGSTIGKELQQKWRHRTNWETKKDDQTTRKKTTTKIGVGVRAAGAWTKATTH